MNKFPLPVTMEICRFSASESKKAELLQVYFICAPVHLPHPRPLATPINIKGISKSAVTQLLHKKCIFNDVLNFRLKYGTFLAVKGKYIYTPLIYNQRSQFGVNRYRSYSFINLHLAYTITMLLKWAMFLIFTLIKDGKCNVRHVYILIFSMCAYREVEYPSAYNFYKRSKYCKTKLFTITCVVLIH